MGGVNYSKSRPVLDIELVALLHYQHTCARAQHQDIPVPMPKLFSSRTWMPVEFKYNYKLACRKWT